jgi:hypothetical protein
MRVATSQEINSLDRVRGHGAVGPGKENCSENKWPA